MARNDVLVTTEWAEANLATPGLVFVEVDEDTTAYDAAHLDGAVKLDWKLDLQDPVRRDFVNKEQFEALLSAKGIANDDTVVLYGGNNNWFAAYAFWYFKLYGHQDVRLEALLAHATQVDPTSPFWFGLPREVTRSIHPFDDYILARSLVDADLPEDDLFAGVREPVIR